LGIGREGRHRSEGHEGENSWEQFHWAIDVQSW
jgi:hypothetical protein